MRRFAPGWKMTLFALLMLPITIALGFWQLARAAEKQALEDSFYDRFGMLPVPAPADPAGIDFLRVRLEGRYLPGRDYLVDNRIERGRPGYWVVSVFGTLDGRRWLVNRGWLAGAPQRDQLPEVPGADGAQTLVGVVWPDTGLPPLLAPDPWPAGWPRRVQRLDVARMAADDERVVPVEIRLEPDQPGVLEAAPTQIDFAPARHQGYAVQWFGLALVLCVGYAVFGLTKRQESP
ncbi:MAG: SURF1 family protein [Pseudomonadales bacterium]